MKKELDGTWEKKKKKDIGRSKLMVPNKFATRSNPEKTGRSCEVANFSWLSSKVS
jgi:hypothetical protein